MRVVLNTKLWSDMICEKVLLIVRPYYGIDKYSNNVSAQANEKNIRISALDEGEVYLKVDLQFLKMNAGENLPDRLQY